MNRRRAGRPARLAALTAALFTACGALAATPPDPARVPWGVRHELNRAEALLRHEDARLRLGDDVQVLRESAEEVVLRVPARLLFSPDSEALRPGLKAAQMLSVPTTLLRRRRHLMTRIEVYTDNIGGLQLNEQLSARRASALADVLRSAGISAHRVQAYGRGAVQALAGNDSAAGRTLNRRVEFVFARIGSQAAQPLQSPQPPPPDASPASAELRPAPAAAPSGG
ncbi:MAG TPA: OmpA family protein [Steroidobacteraceae bacterium]|nr:OmpA family protein [Steroidobacteraceae bacterium]